jgi:glycosyltransferase involved in cell wall biosynthesis
LDFVEAARLLPRNWKFQIAGAPFISAPGYAESVSALAKDLPIEFLGWREDLPGLYSNFDLLVVPSAPGEGFGRVIIEAFSADVPVVAYESGGIAELIEDEVTGYLVRPQTPHALAERIRGAISDPEGRLRIAQRAREVWESNYTIGHYRDRVTNLIAHAASRASNAAVKSTGR